MHRVPTWDYDQAAVIPFQQTPETIRILLISNRRGSRWIVPKGLIDPGYSARETAAKEALEEAGITGKVGKNALGMYFYDKWGGTCRVTVFPMEVTQMQDDWEESFRKRQWMTVEEAIRNTQEPDLRQMIGQLARTLTGG